MSNPAAAMLVIGDEILSGRTRDANVQFLAGRLSDHGIDLKEVRVVADDHAAIVDAVLGLSHRWANVFTSGGIGPTHDDITADAIADAFGRKIDVRADARAILEERYANTEYDLNPARLRMARIPEGAELILNPISAAPGFSLENVHVCAGVPKIFQAMVEYVIPQLAKGQLVLSRTIRVDRPEGEIAGPLGDVAANHPNVSIGSYPFYESSGYGSNVVIRGLDADAIDAAEAAIRKVIGI